MRGKISAHLTSSRVQPFRRRVSSPTHPQQYLRHVLSVIKWQRVSVSRSVTHPRKLSHLTPSPSSSSTPPPALYPSVIMYFSLARTPSRGRFSQEYSSLCNPSFGLTPTPFLRQSLERYSTGLNYLRHAPWLQELILFLVDFESAVVYLRQNLHFFEFDFIFENII